MCVISKVLSVVKATVFVVLVGTGNLFAAHVDTINYRPELKRGSPKLDVYSFDGAKNAPVLIYVHGGGWKQGRRQQVGVKPRYYNEKGYVFVSIDYRLIPMVRIEDQLADIDQALGWIADNIGHYGGDGRNMHLMGHSAGAHLVSMVGLAPGKNGKSLIGSGALRTVISNDTMAYDMSRIAAAGGGVLPNWYGSVFGREPARWERLSPQNYVEKSRNLPAFLILYSGKRFAEARKTTSQRFTKRLLTTGSTVELFNGSKFNHRQMTVLIGVDDELTGAIDRFLWRYK